MSLTAYQQRLLDKLCDQLDDLQHSDTSDVDDRVDALASTLSELQGSTDNPDDTTTHKQPSERGDSL